MSAILCSAGLPRFILTLTWNDRKTKELKVSTRRKASHNLNITGIGVDHPIQTIGSNYAFIISPSLLLSIYIIPYTLTKVKLVSLTFPNVSTQVYHTVVPPYQHTIHRRL